MTLYCTKNEINELIKLQLIQKLNNELVLKINDIEFVIKHVDDLAITQSPKESDLSGKFSDKQILGYYNDFLDIFPSSDCIPQIKMPKTATKKSGAKAFDYYKKAINVHKFTFEEIRIALLYEIWWRKKDTVIKYINNGKNPLAPTENSLKFMQATQAWLNNVINIRQSYEDALNDTDFKSFIESEQTVDEYINTLLNAKKTGRITRVL